MNNEKITPLSRTNHIPYNGKVGKSEQEKVKDHNKHLKSSVSDLINPLSEKMEYFEDENGYWANEDDIKQALKNFFEEENKIIKDYVDEKICELNLWDLRREAKLKHFGEGLI